MRLLSPVISACVVAAGGVLSAAILYLDITSEPGLVLAAMHVVLVVSAGLAFRPPVAYGVTGLGVVLCLIPLIVADDINLAEVLYERVLTAIMIGVVGTLVVKWRAALSVLKDSMARHEALVGSAHDAIITFDEFGTVEMMNTAARELFGYKSDQLQGLSIRTLLPDEFDTEDQTLTGTLRLTADSLTLAGHHESEAANRDGTILLVEVNLSRAFVNGRPLYSAVVRDISARKLSERQLRESQRTLSTLMSNLPGMAYRCLNDDQWTMLFVSHGCRALTGYETYELINNRRTSYAKIIYPEDRLPVDRQVQEALQERRPFELTYRIVCADGQVRWVWEKGQAVAGHHSSVTCLEGFITDITALKTIEEALRESESRFRNIADTTPFMIWTAGLDKGITFASARVTELTGLPSEALMQDGWVGSIHPDDKERVLRDYAAAFDAWETFKSEYRLRRHDGVYRWILVVGTPRFAPGGEFIGYVGSAIDITERKCAEEALRLSESRYRLLFEDSPVALVEEDFSEVRTYLLQHLHGTVTDDLARYLSEHPEVIRECFARVRRLSVNSRALALLGATNFEQFQDGMKRFPSESTLVAFGQFLGALWRGEVTREDEGQGTAVNGSKRRFIVRGMVIPGSEQTWDRVVTSFTDITLLSQAQQELRSTEERYRRLFEDSPLPLIECDLSEVRRHMLRLRDGGMTSVQDHFLSVPGAVDEALRLITFRHVNDASFQLWGVCDSNAFEQHLAGSFTRETARAFADCIAAFWEGSTSFETETEIRRRDGEVRQVVGHSSLTPMGLADWSQMLVSLHDVTDARRAAEELARAKRLETAGRLAGQIAHDFNNLLGPLVAYPEILQARLPAEGSHQDMLRDMQDAALQIAEINQQLLTLGRRGHYNTEALDLNTLVRSTIASLDLPSTVTLALDLCKEPLSIEGGGAQLTRVLLNLLNNAVEAMEAEGLLSVASALLHLEVPRGALKPGKYAHVRISDTGCGMKSEIIEQIFEPFFTTKRADLHRGSGLGLSVVHSVIEDHGGHVDVESQPGQGSSFNLYFPIVESPLPPPVRPAPIAEGAGEKVLVVDDNPMQQRVIQAALERMGYRVSVVNSGEKAVSFVADFPQDVVILDMVMTGMDGAEALHRIREMYPEQKALLLTGFTTTERAEKVISLGDCEVLCKPIQVSALTAALNRILHRASGPADAQKDICATDTT